MPRGGINSGTPQPTWNFGKTCTIRIPEALKDTIYKLARIVDINNGNVLLLSNDEYKYLIKTLNEGLDTPSNNGTKSKKAIKKALEILKDPESLEILSGD